MAGGEFTRGDFEQDIRNAETVGAREACEEEETREEYLQADIRRAG